MRCKAGDLAVIVRDRLGIDEGKIVEVLSLIGFIEDGQDYTDPTGHEWVATRSDYIWWVRAGGTPLVAASSWTGKHYEYEECPFHDSSLRPLPAMPQETLVHSADWAHT